ncbi:MAG: beta-lactamase family protein [Armatimonadetes bacterium]|nr:beta-lactamase family protein [Armatimonadota bacterium]
MSPVACLCALLFPSPPKMALDNPYAQFTDRWHQAAKGLGASSYSLVVVKDGKVALLESWGYRDLEQSKAADPDTCYYIASLTKTYTALAVTKLEEQGKLNVKDPVTKYLPWFKLSKAPKQAVTVEDLLSHRLGIDCSQAVLLDAYTGEITEDRYRHWLGTTGIAADRTAYSNVHFTLLGRIIEKVTGKDWRVALEDIVFKPLGLTNTTAFASSMYGRDNCAAPLMMSAGSFQYAKPVKIDSTMHAAGGMGTTARDLGKYITNLLSSNLGGRLFTRLSTGTPNGSIRIRDGFARAWSTGSYRKLTPLLTHGGGYAGAASMVAMLPEKGIGFGLLVNGDGPASALEAIIMLDVFDHELGLKGQADLLPDYLIEAAAYYDKKPTPKTNLAFQPILIVDVKQIAGTYTNKHLGKLTFEVVDGLFVAKLGHFTLDLKQENGAFTLVGERLGTSLKPIVKDNRLLGFTLTWYGRSDDFLKTS